MINTLQFTRGSKQKTANVGLNETGKTRCYIEEAELHPVMGQAIRKFPKRIIIDFDETEGVGEATSIQTIWRDALISTTGKPIPGTGGEKKMWSNEKDKDAFFQAFSQALINIVNGEIRSIEGHNRQPLFDAVGNRIPDSVYDTTAAPTFDYSTHNADGTPINPEQTI